MNEQLEEAMQTLAEIKALLEIMRRGDSMTNTPLGTQRQERSIWKAMTQVAARALQAEFPQSGG